MIITPSMILITSTWGEPAVPTFKMIPVSLECPYGECIFDPGAKILAVISKIPMKKYTMIPKLDAAGNRIMEFTKENRKTPVGYKQERVQMDSYNEYYIEDPAEITGFIRAFAVNYDNDYKWKDKVAAFLVKQEVPPGEITLGTGLSAVKD